MNQDSGLRGGEAEDRKPAHWERFARRGVHVRSYCDQHKLVFTPPQQAWSVASSVGIQLTHGPLWAPSHH